MNDEFEERLRSVEFNSPPCGQRERIVNIALAESSHSAAPAPLPILWNEILWPAPKVWLAVAAAWVVMIALNFGEGPPDAGTSTAGDSSNISTMVLLNPDSLLEILDDHSSNADPERERKPAVERPRSDRRKHRSVSV